MKIAVGMSGGVDSSVAAFLLSRGGHEVVGVTMNVWGVSGKADSSKNTCFGQNKDIRAVKIHEACKIIGIESVTFDLSREFSDVVLSNFRSEYLSGRTPNPCVLCNSKIKFGFLAEKARAELGADCFATGHYAKIEFDENGRNYKLLKARDLSKDQSYFLYSLNQNQLSRTLFPLGGLLKEETVEIARNNGFSSWSEPESQDFYSGKYSDLLNTPPKKGGIFDTDKTLLGYHWGTWNFTVGQRHGLKIAHSEPLYVVSIDPKNNSIVVGTRNESLKRIFYAKEFNWLSANPDKSEQKAQVKLRAAHRGSSCYFYAEEDDLVKIILDCPEPGIAEGQSAVIYDDDTVIGGGIIAYDS
ncbi:tRNA 2-thiouridine(34) synthase MnmA [candidate division WOR-3 bacterium]|nr:tRNA 2-thiouridine(34) synthase MnmA [candidate division WOR-3 bacterium]